MEVAVVLAAVLSAFYFILLRPVLQQQRVRRRDLSALEVGDEVLTTGGFYATVRAIATREQGPVDITLEVAPGVTLRGTPDAVQRVVRHADPGERPLAADTAPSARSRGGDA